MGVQTELLQPDLSSEVQIGGIEPHQALQFFQRHQIIVGNEYNLYKAGDPGYLRPFLRDSVIATTLAGDKNGLREILKFAATKQGVKKDPRTGEQPGAIFHEYDPELDDGVELSDRPGKTTLYNACDSNALFLLGHEEYIKLSGDTTLRDTQRSNIFSATEYILRHIDENNIGRILT
jgi:glycogen debranching enzyme